MSLKPATAEQVLAVEKAIHHLREARDHLHFAGAPRAADKVREALKSAEGAQAPHPQEGTTHMPRKFRIVRGRDAWAIEEAIVEVEGVDTPEEAEEWASWRENAASSTGRRRATSASSTTPRSWKAKPRRSTGTPEPVVEQHKYYALTGAERDTVLAALRVFQAKAAYDGGVCGEQLTAIIDIATNGGAHPALDVDAIDALCERINR